MRRFFLVLPLLLLSSSMLAFSMAVVSPDTDPVDIGFSVFLDAGAADALWASHVYLHGGLGMALVPGVTVEIPLTLVLDRTSGGEMLFDFSVDLKYHPWRQGPFVGVSLAQMCMFVGAYPPEERTHFLNGISFGYTWYILPRFYVEPALIFRDPSGSFNDSCAYIHGLVPGFGKFRICLQAGWRFLSVSPQKG